MRTQHNKQSKKPVGKAKARIRAGKTKGKGRRLTFSELKTEKNIRESRMTVWRRIKENKFPKPFEDHGRIYWWESQIDEYNAELENLPPGSGKPPPPKRGAVS
jgi:hypothetical protein